MQERAAYFPLSLVMTYINFIIYGHFLGMQIFGWNFVDLIKTLSAIIVASGFYTIVTKRYNQIRVKKMLFGAPLRCGDLS